MKKYRLLLVFISIIILFSGCDSSSYLKELKYNELKSKLDSKESFFFVIVQDGCSHCASFTPSLEAVLNEYKVTGYKLNLSKLDEKQKEELNSMFTFDGTPTTIFVKNGVEESMMQRINGNQPKAKIISKLKTNGYIKG